MRVDAVPLWLKPMFHAWAESVGGLIYVKFKALQHTMNFNLQGHLLHADRPVIFAIWHENLLPFFLILKQLNREQIWMNHPLWYMKPIHVLLGHLGIKELVLGSTGHRGQAAMDVLARRLRETASSSMMAVDGPAGPPYKLRKGCLYLGLQTGLPIVPVRFDISDAHRLAFTWDRKVWPKYGSTLTAELGSPIWVTSDQDIDASAHLLAKALAR